MYKDGKMKLDVGLGFFGFSVSVDIDEVWSWLGG